MPTFGKCSGGSACDEIPTGYLYGPMLTMPANGDITKVSVYFYAFSGTVKGKVGIYDDDGGDEPDNLLDTSAEVIGINTTPAWEDFAFIPAYTATKDVKYHFQLFCDASWRVYRNTTGGTTNYKAGQTYDTFPNPYGTITGGNSHEANFCIYYTPAILEEKPLISKPLISPIKVGVPIIRSFKSRFPKLTPRLVI